MPATLTIDDELDARLRSEARREGRPVSELAAELLRAGLAPPAEAASSTSPYLVRPHHGRFADGVRTDRLNQLVDELDEGAGFDSEPARP